MREVERHAQTAIEASLVDGPLAPIPRPAGLEGFAGMWVARIGDDVIAAAPTSRELAYTLHTMDHRKRAEAVMEYVRPSSDAFIVGAG